MAIALAIALASGVARADDPAPAPPSAPAPVSAPAAEPAPAADPTPAADPAPAPAPVASRAETLFQEGKRLLEQGSVAEACARLAESDAIDPTVGTLGLLAACHEQQGRIATAAREYGDAAKRAEAAGDDRAGFARDRAIALAARSPRVLIRLGKPAPSIEVLRDRARIPAGEIGVEVPVDPGAHEILARAPGRQDHRITIRLKEGDRIVVDVPELAPAQPIARGPSPVEPAPAPATTGLSPARLTAALVAGGVGLAGVGLGIGFGVAAQTKDDESKTVRGLCSTAEECAQGRALREDAFTAATVSTLGFGVGAAGIATAVALVLIPSGDAAAAPAPRAALRIAPIAGASGGGAALSGRF